MKTFSLLLFFYITTIDLHGEDIYGNWIKTKTTYIDNTEISDNNIIKYLYLRYSFEKPDIFFMSTVYDDKGTLLHFDIKNKIITIKNTVGYVVNSFFIISITDKELILVQKGKRNFNEPTCIKYHYCVSAS